MTGVIYLVTLAGALMSAGLLFPVLVSFARGEEAIAVDLALIAFLGLFVTLLLLAAFRGRAKRVNAASSLLAAVLIWIVASVYGALPFAIAGDYPFLTGLFESVSGVTTTGATAIVPGSAPVSLLLWRAELEWLGGFMTLTCIIHILAPSGIGGIPHSGGRFFHTRGEHAGETEIYKFYGLFAQYTLVTVVFTGVFIVTGNEPLIAINLAMTAISTGGYLPFGGSLDTHTSVATQLFFAFALLLGAASLLWQRVVFNDLRRLASATSEAIAILAVVGVLTIAYTVRLQMLSGGSAGHSPLLALHEGFFAAASLVSTSGLETRAGVLQVIPELLVLLVVLAGASVFSTAGGIKLFRIGAMTIQARRELALLIHPNSVGASRYLGSEQSRRSVRSVWTVFIVAMFIVAAGAFLLSIEGTGFEAGLTGSIAFFANAGPVYTALKPLAGSAEIWPQISELGTAGKITAIMLMLLGRLEIMVILAILNLNYWIRR